MYQCKDRDFMDALIRDVLKTEVEDTTMDASASCHNLGMEMDEGLEVAEGVHPCLIPHIIEKILGYLPPKKKSKDIFEARCVCKQWAESGSLILRKQLNPRIGLYCVNMEMFEQLITLAENSCSIPVSRFQLCQDVFDPEFEPLFKRFFRTFSGTIESVCMWFDLKSVIKWDKTCFLFSKEEFQSMTFPKMKSIEIDDRRTIDSMYHKYSFEDRGPLLLEWMIHASPNLERLVIQYQREKGGNGFGPEMGGQVTEMLLKMFKNNQKSLRNLKSLELDIHIDDNVLNCLSTLCQNLRLQSLSLCMRGSSFKQESLLLLFSSLKYCLEDLKLVYIAEASNFTVQFPRMERLKLLQITGWDRHNVRFENVHFDNFNYANNLPYLKTLLMSTWTNQADWQPILFPKNGSPVLSVEELQLPESITNRECMESFVKIFPNLKKLNIQVRLRDISLLEVVFGSLTQLTDLTIQKSSLERSGLIIDYVLTGIPEGYCEFILRCNCLNDFKGSYMSHNVKEFMMKPGLTNLKKLKKLDIGDLHYIAEITDVTGYLALLSMESLEYLNVGRSMMGFQCMRKLAAKYPNNMAQQEKLPRLAPKQETEEPFLELPPGRCPLL